MSDEDKRKRPDEETEEAAAADEGDPDQEAELTVEDILSEAPDNGQAADDTVAVLRTTLEERTRDLQRINAEFQNYRKRVERDKSRAGEMATAAVLGSLLPVLDDLDRARDHGDLNGPFGSVAEQLVGALTKQGLESFGEKGDPFDPTVHEAVAHMQSGEVDGPTCIDVMRRGYRLGDRLLRPAMVAVAEPLDEPEAETGEATEEDADRSPAEPEAAAPESAEAEAPQDEASDSDREPTAATETDAEAGADAEEPGDGDRPAKGE